jgi:DHA1 family tetracycline resistance protein-like MFS transporter
MGIGLGPSLEQFVCQTNGPVFLGNIYFGRSERWSAAPVSVRAFPERTETGNASRDGKIPAAQPIRIRDSMIFTRTNAVPGRAAVFFIFITVVLDMLAFGVVIPVLPKLVEQFEGGNTARAAEMFGLMGTLWAFMQFVASPVLGALSDRFGRRPVILLSCFGLGIDFIMMALAPTLAWLFVARAISGITAASFTTAGAYIADVTPPEKRAAGFGILGAAFGVGFVLGPAFGGLLGQIDIRLPFWAAGALCLLNAVYGFFILPESLPPEKRATFSWKRANPVGSLVLLRSHSELSGLATSNFLSHLAHVVLPSVAVLYMGYRYGWDALTIGLTLTGVGVAAMIVQGALVKPIVAKLGERVTLLMALLFGTAGFAIYGLAPTPIFFWMGIPVMAVWGLAMPSSQSLMTRHVSASEQGQLQGANSALMGLAGLFGPILFTATFASFIGARADLHLPGAPFLLASAMLALSAVIAWRATRSAVVPAGAIEKPRGEGH